MVWFPSSISAPWGVTLGRCASNRRLPAWAQ